MTNLKKTIRKDLNSMGIITVTSFPRLRCRRLAKESINPYWVLKETFGYVILNLESLKSFNVIRNKLGLSKLRSRDLNKLAIYRYPKKAFHLR